MLFAGIVISAVAMFLGIFTKFPQGGGGLTNNIMVLSFFLPAPPLLPMLRPRTILFDLEAAIAENEIYYIRNPVVTRNGTQGPITRPRQMPRSAAGSSNATAQSATLKIPAFSFLAFSLSQRVCQLCATIGEAIATFAMVFVALCLPWLVIKKMHLLGKTRPARKLRTTGFGELLTQIEPHNGLFEDLKLIISERDQALAELRDTTEQAMVADRKAAEVDLAKEEVLKRLRAERINALAELAKEKAKLEKLEEEKNMEVDGLKEETTSHRKAWEEKENKWKEQSAEEEKRNKEDIDSLSMGRERESESWRQEVEGLELEKKGTKEAFEAKLKNILEGMRKEREGWGKEEDMLKKEKVGEKAEKEKMAAERKKQEEEIVEEKKAWEEANEWAQRRIAELEEDNMKLEVDAAERQREDEEAEATRKMAEEEKSREQRGGEEKAKAEAKKAIAKLEEEVLNGRKLIGDLQSDKRRDRQLLLELRAQLVRPTHAAPPSHMNALRFGGSAPPAAPAISGPSAPPFTSPPEIPRVNLPSFTPQQRRRISRDQLSACLPRLHPETKSSSRDLITSKINARGWGRREKAAPKKEGQKTWWEHTLILNCFDF